MLGCSWAGVPGSGLCCSAWALSIPSALVGWPEPQRLSSHHQHFRCLGRCQACHHPAPISLRTFIMCFLSSPSSCPTSSASVGHVACPLLYQGRPPWLCPQLSTWGWQGWGDIPCRLGSWCPLPAAQRGHVGRGDKVQGGGLASCWPPGPTGRQGQDPRKPQPRVAPVSPSRPPLLANLVQWA